VRGTGRESRDEPRVDGREGELAALGPFARPRDRVEQPRRLRPREVLVEHEPGALTHERLMARVAQRLAGVGGAAVLPHDRVVDGTERVALVEQRRLALVGDADAGDVPGRGLGDLQRLRARRERRLPDLLRVVLDPAGLREVLRELAVPAAEDAPRRVDEEPSDPRRARVDGEDASGHVPSSLPHGASAAADGNGR